MENLVVWGGLANKKKLFCGFPYVITMIWIYFGTSHRFRTFSSLRIIFVMIPSVQEVLTHFI